MAEYAFATLEEYEARYGAVDADKESMVDGALEDAGLMLRRAVAVDESDEMQAAALKSVSMSMVKRAMATSDSGVFGATQADAQMGPFQQSLHYANPSGDLYITAAERELLGIGGDWAASIPAKVDGWYGSNS